MIPTMVARKMARSCQAFLATPSCRGMNHIIIPVRNMMPNGFKEAPFHCGAAAAAAGAGAGTEVAADA